MRLISVFDILMMKLNLVLKTFLQQFAITFQVVQMRLLEKLLLNMISTDQQWAMPHIQLDQNLAEQIYLWF